jgi:probable HAF family extracellular repeat protein
MSGRMSGCGYVRGVHAWMVAIAWVVGVGALPAQTLTWLGTLGGGQSEAYDVSADGRVVVGMSENANRRARPFLWTAADGMQDLGTLGGDRSYAFGVSAKGNVVVGFSNNADGQDRAFRWTAATGMRDLGTLGGTRSYALGVSADGSVIVGYSRSTAGNRAFRWTEEGGMQDLGTLGGNLSLAFGVSADGNVVVGSSATAGGEYAFRWRSGIMENLGTLPGSLMSRALSASANGSVVVGYAFFEARDDFFGWRYSLRAFRWQGGIMQDLGTLGGDSSSALDVSADGSVVVGWANDATGQTCAFRWTESSGMEDLNITYAHLLTRGSRLQEATAVSPDGRFIAGRGYNAATRRTEPFLLDTCPGGDIDHDCICDDWERNGFIDINADGIPDLELPNAQVGRKDIYIEYDAMRGHKPSPQVLARVQAAFQQRGIGLHIVWGGDLVDEEQWDDPWQGFDAFKSVYFGLPQERQSSNWHNIRRARQRVYRYGVFACCYGDDSASGLAEFPGNDFMVTLGHPDWQFIRDFLLLLPANWDGVWITWDDFVAGVFMHELGHLLGLRHGGGDALNHKPNYASVMNYLWQVPMPAYASSWSLDFSERAFPSLNENALSEPAGIGGRAGRKVPIGGPTGRIVQETGAVDWNNDGDSVDTGVQFDANGDGQLGVLDGFADWSAIDCGCGSPNWADGVHIALAGAPAELSQELSADQWLTAARAGALLGDVSLDGCVDDTDLLLVLFTFGQSGRALITDVDGNGIVDDADLLAVLFQFGRGCGD